MQIGFILSLVFAILVAIFAIQNSSVIVVNFLFAKVEISQALIIFISAILGAVIIMLLGLRREFNLKHNNKQLTKKINEMELESLNLSKENKELKDSLYRLKETESVDKESAADKE
ncbi:Lipopolysaccharide assembly protein A [Clostridium liquoris]|jgi:uncharacterized integral membrane protein|uniref:Lipopolysaccharide assembly protein A n=1 Tax=Clostridium liquoris TaxID=1289519 RepID=A0A2T0B8G9_9CLOT|nr:LapA family protein [Clostridium liquoris]PRR80152.1 Lipopolysaccharide assembly protein A [Clostridium liquoris]